MTATLAGCKGPARLDPDAWYRDIQADFVHGDLDRAVARAGEARLKAAAAGLDPAWSWKFRLLQANALLKQGRWEDVIGLLQTTDRPPAVGDLAIERDLLLSGAEYNLDRGQDADRHRVDARRLAESGNSPLLGEVFRAEALAERDAGHWEAASSKLNASLEVAHRRGDRWLETLDLVSLGFIDLQNERYDRAAFFSQRAFAAAQALQARDQIHRALGNLGWALFCLGEYERAVANFQEAERGARLMGNTHFQVRWLQDAGLAEYKLGNLMEAQRYDEQALSAAMRLPAAESADLVADIEANLALLLVQRQDLDAALRHSERAADAAGRSKDVNVRAYATFVQALVSTRRPGGGDAEPLYLQARQMTTDREIRMSVENALARLYVERHRPTPAEAWFRRSIRTFEERRATVRDEALRLSAFAKGDGIYRDYAEFLVDSRRPAEALGVLDRGRARTLEEGLGFSGDDGGATGRAGLDVQSLARRLDATILFYSLGAARSHLWVIGARDTRLVALPGEPDLRARVEALQREIRKSADPLRTGSASALGLYEILIGPAAAALPPGGRVYIVPDGILHGLNFETLIRPDGAGFKYWIEDATIVTASSIRMLSRSPVSAPATGAGGSTRDLLLIGDPLAAAAGFEPLPNAADEMQRVRQHFDGASQTVLARARASPAAYAGGAPDQYRYIHFVAHGTASAQSPLDSAVILSPDPGSADDFKLYAREVVRHPLRARLVTISACNGSGVRTYAGEGLVGLAWAFLRAGAHSVIGALWQADDGATPLLMDRLYAELQAGAPPEAALRTAKLALIRSESVYRKPLYWAPFQLYAGS